MEDGSHPRRKWLRHGVPLPVHDREPVFFITLCCRTRQRNQLAHATVWEAIRESVEQRNLDGRWHCPLLLAMPDHVHGILTLDHADDLTRTIASWKRWLAVGMGIGWQRGFFDHRLRSSMEALEKGIYILRNPVRAGLVGTPEEWPFRHVDATWLTDDDASSDPIADR